MVTFRWTSVLAAAFLAALAAPAATATDYYECDVTGTACLAQSSYGDPTCENEYWGYGYNSVDAAANGAYAGAGGGQSCYDSGWGYSGSDRYLYAYATTGSAGAGLWWSNSEWSYSGGVDGKGGGDGWSRQLGAAVYGLDNSLGYEWAAYSYGGEPTDEVYCYSYVYEWGALNQFRELGCPLGNPPESPAVPWGALLP